MKKLVLLALCSTALLSTGISYAHHGDHDEDENYESVSRTVDLKGFDKIRLEGVYDVDVIVGEDFSIDLSGDAREMKRTELYLDGQTLVLDQNHKRKKTKFKNNKGVKARIILPALYEVTVEGVGKGEFENIKADNFEIHVEGVGGFTFEGTCGTLDVHLEGVGEVDARGLECDNVNAQLEGIGELSVYASESIDAETDGIGQIDVYGKPKHVEKSKGFLSNVTIN